MKAEAWYFVDEEFKFKSGGVSVYDADQEWGRMEVAKGNGAVEKEWPKCLFVTNVVVVPLYRGKGYGLKVMQMLEELARSASAEAVVLKAETPAVTFYLKLGYTIQNTQEELATKPELQNHILMRKEIVYEGD